MDSAVAGFEDHSVWQPQANVTLEADTDTVYSGSQSARVEGDSGTIVGNFDIPLDLSKKDISIAVKVEKPRPTNLRIWFTDSRGNETRLIQQINQNHPGGWIRINPSINSVNADLSSVEEILITLDGDGEGKRYWLDDIRFHDKRTNKGQFMFTFDDIVTDVYETAFPIMQEYDLKGALAVPPAVIGYRNRINQDQLEEMHGVGWEIASHSDDLQGLYGLPREQQRKKLERAKEIIKGRGFGDAPAFMYPGGACDNNTLELVSELHDVAFLTFKGAEKGLSQSALMNPHFVNRSRPNTDQAVINQVDPAIQYRGLYTMYLHYVNDDAVINADQFRRICEFVADKRDSGELEVVRPSDVIPNE
ncbi:polysaccharide deacetylase family protein [Halegenticoccus soli]|uniref:polysaccharide deacetylase family protein n=1 Tax=Halegenticoccus soli TaxID=1985678 RepID=UPI00130429F6|nr:polysaccharide deacetylase family protein [Halegenticoccus soli]